MASELLASVLHADSQINVVAAVASSAETSGIVEKLRPEVILLSCNLDGNSNRGLEFAAELLAHKPEIRIVMLLDTSSPEPVFSAFRSGASGVFSREGSLHSLCRCIHSVYR